MMALQTFVVLAAFGSSVLAVPSGMGTRALVPHYLIYADTTPSCALWWDNDGSIACEDVPDAWGFTWDDFVRWVSQ
jgi:hypothetical protein